jgi:hypothetical protein
MARSRFHAHAFRLSDIHGCAIIVALSRADFTPALPAAIGKIRQDAPVSLYFTS